MQERATQDTLVIGRTHCIAPIQADDHFYQSNVKTLLRRLLHLVQLDKTQLRIPKDRTCCPNDERPTHVRELRKQSAEKLTLTASGDLYW
jgi:hypothetical protein